MKKKLTINTVKIDEVPVADLVEMIDDWELQIILGAQPLTRDVDVMLDNMLEYFVEEELYNYACVVRDEIQKRKPL
ncbi:hypothetical protein ACFPVY_04080 [Flavobacterium qiangtangense]|uniref:Uncharacterized protein n=1 Tax=Flavobacterium qiangtangense TaxID=1442595 RepID=A0ABW1PJK8_9FLAO